MRSIFSDWRRAAFVVLIAAAGVATAVYAASGHYAQCGASHGIVMGWEGSCLATYEAADKQRKEHRDKWGSGHDGSVLACTR